MKKPVVLIVDDNKLNVEVLLSMLEDRYDLRIARDGRECLSRSLIEPYPDLILLDIMMPVLDGYETIKILKKDELTRNIPVIFLTALSGKDDIVKGFQLGAVDYLAKPFNMTELIARLETHLELKFSREKIEKQKAALEQLNSQLQVRISEQRSYIAKSKILQANLIQKNIPLLESFSIQALYMPSEDMGGDFFSIVNGVHESRLAVILGDCTGHGILASIEASLLTSIMQKNMSLLFESGNTSAFMSEVNKGFIQVADEDKFPTLFVCILDLRSGRLSYSNANGVLPSLFRDGQTMHFNRVQGMHLGYAEDTVYESSAIQLREGDRLYFYSDAVIEYDEVKFDQSGREKLEAILASGKGIPSADFGRIISELEEAAGGLPLPDDTTFIQIDYTGTYRNSFTFSTLEEYDEIFSIIEQTLYSHDYTRDDCSKIIIGLDEMCLNAYYHGNREDTSMMVTVEAFISCRDVSFIISDMGDGFDPAGIIDPAVCIEEIYKDGNPEEYMHGRGIAIVRIFYDSVIYNERGNSVTIRRKKERKYVSGI